MSTPHLRSPILTFDAEKLSTGAHKGGCSFPFVSTQAGPFGLSCQGSSVVPVVRSTTTRDAGHPIRTLPWASRGHLNARLMSTQRLRSPILTFDAKKLSTSANEQMEDAASPFVFCLRTGSLD